MTWCPLLCYPLSPSPVNIERFFKLGAKFCRKKISSQALNCFLLLVHTASSFATGQKELMFQRESPNVWGWQSGWSRHWTRRFAFFSHGEVAFCLPLPRLPSVAVDYHFRYLVLYQDLEWFESIIDNCHFLEYSILAAFPRSSCQPLEIWQPQSK